MHFSITPLESDLTPARLALVDEAVCLPPPGIAPLTRSTCGRRVRCNAVTGAPKLRLVEAWPKGDNFRRVSSICDRAS